MYDKVLVCAPRSIYLMIMSYQVIAFLWCVMVAQLANHKACLNWQKKKKKKKTGDESNCY
jgi:uncharacterized membrane protein